MASRETLFSAANLLSLSRPPLGFLFAVTLVAPWGGRGMAVSILGVAGVTDALDGYIARRAYARAQTRTERRPSTEPQMGNVAGATALVQAPAGMGSWLDPICDKVFVATVLGAIWLHSRPPVVLVVLILARELAQFPLALVYALIPTLRHWLRYDFRASALGKAATVCQFTAVVALLFESALAPAAAALSCGVGFMALADYVVRAVRIGQRRVREQAARPAAVGAPARSEARIDPPPPSAPR